MQLLKEEIERINNKHDYKADKVLACMWTTVAFFSRHGSWMSIMRVGKGQESTKDQQHTLP